MTDLELYKNMQGIILELCDLAGFGSPDIGRLNDTDIEISKRMKFLKDKEISK